MSSTASGGGACVLVAPLMPMPVDPRGVLRALEHDLGVAARVAPVKVALRRAFDASRDQHSSSAILLQLLEVLPATGERVVGLVDHDLFVPVLTYVFGEAQLGGRVAIVSSFRLREPWLRQSVPQALVERRFRKTVLHEAGHLFGLRHCSDPSCVMASASSLEMLDEKGDELCLDCRSRVVDRAE